jgi:hypothetical protein
MRPIDLIKTHQQKIALVIGYCLMAGLAFGLGRISATSQAAPEIKVEEAFVPLNDTPEPSSNQSQSGSNPQPAPGPSPISGPNPSPAPVGSIPLDCGGKIKGNISGSNRVYHKPGGSSYNRTKPEACFNTEAEAQAAGFRPAAN